MQADRFERFGQRNMMALSLASDEAIRFGHSNIGTQHLILGIIRSWESPKADSPFYTIGITLPKAREALLNDLGKTEEQVTAPTLTKRAKEAIGLSVDICKSERSPQLESVHLLMGVLEEGEARQMLRSISPEALIKALQPEFLTLLRETRGSETPPELLLFYYEVGARIMDPNLDPRIARYLKNNLHGVIQFLRDFDPKT